MNKKIITSQSYIVGIILAFIGGYIDAYTYLVRGNVFSNAQTGNIVLLGINIAKGNLIECYIYFFPILSFLVGIIFTEMVIKRKHNFKVLSWKQIILIIESISLIIISFIPCDETYNIICTSLISFVCSLQIKSFNKINGMPYTTTMCISNLRNATEKLYEYKHTKDNLTLKGSFEYFGIVILFLLGAMISGILVNIFKSSSIIFGCFGLLIVFIILFNEHKKISTNL